MKRLLTLLSGVLTTMATTAARADLLWCVLDKCVTYWVVGQITPTFLHVYNFLMVVCLFIVSMYVYVCV